NIEMLSIGWSVPEDLRPEVSNVQPEHRSLAHRAIAARGRPDPAVAAQRDAADRRQPPAEVRVFAMELDRTVEAADLGERVASDGEVAAIQNRADPERVVQQNVGWGRHAPVVRAHESTAAEVPVVEAVRPCDRDHTRVGERALDVLEPTKRGTAVGV